jgi:hypothetical protein
MNAMSFAKLYNEITGANITHFDVENMGYSESRKLELVMDALQPKVV